MTFALGFKNSDPDRKMSCNFSHLCYNEINKPMEVLHMAYKISDDCVACGACAEECPVNAITEGDGKYEIDPEKCIDCGTCASTCPVGAPNPQ